MSQQLPEYGYIVGFIACIILVFAISFATAGATGYHEK
jgi:hypothetical protein